MICSSGQNSPSLRAYDVTEANVSDKIKMGGPGMPSFGTTLKDAGYRRPHRLYQGRMLV